MTERALAFAEENLLPDRRHVSGSFDAGDINALLGRRQRRHLRNGQGHQRKQAKDDGDKSNNPQELRADKEQDDDAAPILKPNSGPNSAPNNQPNKFIVCNYETYQNRRTANRTADRTANRTHSKEGLKEGQKEGKSNPSLFDLKNDQKDSGLLLDQPQEKPKRKNTATASPEVFEITASMEAWAKSHVPAIDILSQTEAFLDFHKAKGNVFRDWEAAWRTWMRNAQKWGTKAAYRGRSYQDVHEINRQTFIEMMEMENAKRPEK